MDAMKNGGPAFGHAAENGYCCGMTLRQWYAGMAMAGLMENRKYNLYATNVIARIAFDQADAMLAAEREAK